MAESRTKYVFKNLSVGIGCEILNSVLGFILRYFFILHLGIEYLGVNGKCDCLSTLCPTEE